MRKNTVELTPMIVLFERTHGRNHVEMSHGQFERHKTEIDNHIERGFSCSSRAMLNSSSTTSTYLNLE